MSHSVSSIDEFPCQWLVDSGIGRDTIGIPQSIPFDDKFIGLSKDRFDRLPAWRHFLKTFPSQVHARIAARRQAKSNPHNSSTPKVSLP